MYKIYICLELNYYHKIRTLQIYSVALHKLAIIIIKNDKGRYFIVVRQSNKYKYIKRHFQLFVLRLSTAEHYTL